MNNSNEEIKSKLDHAVLISLQLCIKMFQEHNKLNPEAEYNKFTTLDLLCILLCTLDVGLPFVFLFWDLLLKCCILSHVLSSSSSPPTHTLSLFPRRKLWPDLKILLSITLSVISTTYVFIPRHHGVDCSTCTSKLNFMADLADLDAYSISRCRVHGNCCDLNYIFREIISNKAVSNHFI